MKTRFFPLMLVALAPVSVSADVWITNFTSATGGSAPGVWRNATTGVDTSIQVEFTHVGSSVFDSSTDTSTTFFWQDFITNLFEPNYVGDIIVLELPGLGISSVNIDFGAEVVNPILHFSDIDSQTSLVFTGATPVQVAGLSNMGVLGNTVFSAGENPFIPGDFETLGSVAFTGTFTELSFGIFNSGPSPSEDDDRTGFSVATLVEPTPVLMDPSPLGIMVMNGNVYLSWANTNMFSEIQYTTNLAGGIWMPLLGVDPTTMTSAMIPTSMFGTEVYLRAQYIP